MDNMEADYDARPELDNYEQDGLDEGTQQELSMDARFEVDRKLEQEERRRI